MQYLPVLKRAYDEYRQLLPLDMQHGADQNQVRVWQDVIQYSLPEYARKVAVLAASTSLDDFVRRSGGDFDNLALVIKTALAGSLISISNDGKITANQQPIGMSVAISESDALTPRAEYNQFPCDSESSDFRAQYILGRYPYAEKVHVGLIGDDDFISLRLMKNSATEVSVVEKDSRIVEEIESRKGDSHDVHVYELDIRDTAPNISLDTFVTDPPYTFDGALSFIVCGLAMMGATQGKEFYVILNPTMIGKRWHRLVAALAEQGIFLVSTENAVSNYKLPDNFDERKRADAFLESISVATSALQYSSNSTMYTFQITSEVDLGALRSVINSENIYEHYV